MPISFSPPFDLPLPPCPNLPSPLPFPFPWPFPLYATVPIGLTTLLPFPFPWSVVPTDQGGGGEWGGPFGPLAMPPVGRGGGEGGRHGSPGPRGPANGRGVASFPRPPLPRAGFSRRPSLRRLIPRPLSRGAGRSGVAVRVSGQRLAGCGAAGSPPRSLSPHSLPREVACPLASCRTVGGGVCQGAQPPPPSPVPAVWAFTCAAACVGAGAAAAAGCAGGSASGRGRCAKPGGANCWRSHP